MKPCKSEDYFKVNLHVAMDAGQNFNLERNMTDFCKIVETGVDPRLV